MARPFFAGHLHELTDARRIQRLERIALQDLLLLVDAQELADVVAREAERHLRQVVGAEREELRFGRHLVRGQRAARHFDHRADEVLHLDAVLLDRLRRDAIDDRLLIAQLLHVPDERDHDLGNDRVAFLRELARRRDDRPGLHLGDLGIGDAETHAAMAEHRVELVELFDAVQQRLLLAELALVAVARFQLGDLDHQVFALRQELVERRIDQADGHGRAVHRLEHAVEVVALERQQLVERGAAIGFVVRQNHPLHDRDAAFAEEHVLRAAQTDAARAEGVGQLRLIRQVRVGADAERAELVRRSSGSCVKRW